MSKLIDLCPLDNLRPGEVGVVVLEDVEIGVFNCAGSVYAIESRCSHDNALLVEGILDQENCTVECPRHGSVFDLRTGMPITLPASLPVGTFRVTVEDETIKLQVE